jgi:hypothetical protein
MLVIRTEQFDAFRRAEWETFLETIEDEVREILASRADPRATAPLGGAVSDAVKLGQYHGFHARPLLQSFARIVVVAGPGWETAAARAVLNETGLTAEARLDLLATAVDL